MKQNLITPWPTFIVGIFSIRFAIAFPSLDQYSERNHYQTPQYKARALINQGIAFKGIAISDVKTHKQIIERWLPLQTTFDNEPSYEIQFSRLEDSYIDDDPKIFLNLKKNDSLYSKTNVSVVHKTKLSNHELKENSTKLKFDIENIANKIKDFFDIQNDKQSQTNFDNALKKRRKPSLDNVYIVKKRESEEKPIGSVMSLQELLKHWGINVSDEKPTVRSQRGDIEITELISPTSSTRGDVPASFLHHRSLKNLNRNKRDIASTGRKLLWSSNETPETDMWGFSENDGLSPNEQVSYESEEPKNDKGRNYIKGNRHNHGINYVYDSSNARLMREKQKIEEEKRLQWEEQERRKDEEQRRRIDEEQRAKDEEQRRRDEEQRRNEEEQQRRDDEQRKNEEEYERITEEQHNYEEEQRRIQEGRRRNDEEQRRRDEEQRRNEEEHQRREDKQRIREEAQRKNEEERRSIEKEQEENAKYRERINEEELRKNYNDQRRNNEQQNRDRDLGRKDESRGGDDNGKRPLKDDNYESRLRERQRMKSENDRLLRERGKNRNRGKIEKTPEEIENEKKLEDYIRRNTPIVIGNQVSHNPFQLSPSVTMPEQRKPDYSVNRPNERRPGDVPENRPEEYHRRIDEERKQQDRQRNEQEEQMRRRQEEYRKRQEEERRLHESEYEAASNRNGNERIRHENQNNNQPSNENERLSENEDIRIAEQSRRLVEEQKNRYEEQRRRQNEEFRRANGFSRGGPSDNQRYVIRDPEYSTEEKPSEAIGHERPSHRHYDSQQDNSVNQAMEIRNDRYLPPYDRHRQSEEKRPPWTEASEAVTPVVTIDDKGMVIEEEDKDKQNKGFGTAEEIGNSRGRDRPDQRSNVQTIGWLPPKQDVLQDNEKWQLNGKSLEKTRGDEANRRYYELKEMKNRRFRPLTDSERKEEEERLRKLPVSATIIVRNNSRDNNNSINQTIPTEIGSRGDFDDGDITFPGISPYNKGIEVPEFQREPVMRRPPIESPKTCVWSIVICCSQLNSQNANRLRQCFEATNCPGANWDANRCSQQKVKSANKEIMQFYLKNQPARSPTTIIF